MDALLARPFSLEAVLAYALRGWRVLPLAPGRKTPAIKDWPRRAGTDPQILEHWWSGRNERRGIGVATGAGSGVFVLDVDKRSDGEEHLAALIARFGPLPTTVTAHTAGGGRHFYFRCPPGQAIRNRVGLLGRPGIDLRGDGGYVVAPPTTLEGGGVYAWAVGLAPSDVAVADPPAWLVGVATAPEASSKEARGALPAGNTRTIPIGCRHRDLLREAGRLRRLGYGPGEVSAVLLFLREHRCEGIDDPAHPFGESEVRQIVESVCRYPAGTSDWLADACKDDLQRIMVGPRPERGRAILGDGLVPERSVAMLFGPSNVGKTQVAIALALAVGGGRDFFGWRTSTCSVLVVCPELDLAEFLDRVEAIERAECAHRGWDPAAGDVRAALEEARSRVFPLTGDMLPRVPDLTNLEDREALASAIRARSAKLVLLDPFALIHTADENSNDEMLAVMRGLHAIRVEADTTPLVVHHPRKGRPGQADGGFDAMRGAGAIAAHSRVILRLDERAGRVCLSCPKATHSRRPDPIWLERTPTGALVLSSPPEDAREARRARAEAVIRSVIDRGGKPVALDEILMAVPAVHAVNERTVRAYLQAEMQRPRPRIEALGTTRDRRWRARR